MAVDFGRTHADYASYRPPFDPRLIRRLAEFKIGVSNQRILDLGGGTGLLADALEATGAEVVLADASEALLHRSSHLQRIAAKAEELPFDSGSFDAVACAQCWHWFDRVKAPAEVHRVLRPAGGVAVVYQTYVPLPGSVAHASEQVILTHQPRWRHANSTGLNGQVLRDLQISGFAGIESFSFDVQIAFSRESWNGFLRTTSPVGASMDANQVQRFEQDHLAMLGRYSEPLMIPHRVFAVVAHKAT